MLTNGIDLDNLIKINSAELVNSKNIIKNVNKTVNSSSSVNSSTENLSTNLNHSSLTNNKETVNSSPSSKSSRAASPINEARRIHRVVFTGGPCAGKTTSINRIKTFFENIGWKVLCVPETATVLLSTGVYFYDLKGESKMIFQENLLKTMLQIEDTINETAKHYLNAKNQNCLVIYDRGAMDPVAYMSPDDWEELKARNPTWNEVDLRDNRYDQIIHMITAANGAEQFYTLENNVTRTESIELAREIDEKCAKAWIGHPILDCIDNCGLFEVKVARTLQMVCERIGLHLKGFDVDTRKRKFLVKSLPDDSMFPDYQELNVVHNYLISNTDGSQARIRKRGQSGNWSYSYAIRLNEDGQQVETRSQIDRREYSILTKTIDPNNCTIYQRRRCFIWRHRYYRLDIYEEPCNPRCRGLILLSIRSPDPQPFLPQFIKIEREVTNEEAYSMFNLSSKKE